MQGPDTLPARARPPALDRRLLLQGVGASVAVLAAASVTSGSAKAQTIQRGPAP